MVSQATPAAPDAVTPSAEPPVPGPPGVRHMAARRGLLPAMLFFLSVVSAIDLAAHYYLARRLVLDAQLGGWATAAGVIALVIAALGLIAAPIAQRTAPLPVARALAWPAYIWMGLLWLTLVLLALSDLGLWVAGLAGFAPATAAAALSVARMRAISVLIGAVALTLLGMVSALSVPRVRRRELTLPGWPRVLDGFRLVQLSDLHIGAILGRRFAEGIATRVDALEPDAIAITGDLVDGDVAQLAPAVAPLARMRSRLGTYFVTGNHDHYSGAGPWDAELRRQGVHVLRNERVSLDGAFDLVGVDDRQSSMVGGGGEDLDEALEGRDPQQPWILLAHQPPVFAEAARRGVALQLSGHTHGGQIAPFMLLTRLLYSRYVAGLYRLGESQLYLSRGTGFWGPPLRLLAPAEITLLTLRSPS